MKLLTYIKNNTDHIYRKWWVYLDLDKLYIPVDRIPKAVRDISTPVDMFNNESCYYFTIDWNCPRELDGLREVHHYLITHNLY